MTKVISYGTKRGIDTAQIVYINNGHSRTLHLWHTRDGWMDRWGEKWDIKGKKL